MFARLSIRSRLLALLMIPAVILVVIAGLQLRDALGVVSRTGDLERLTQVARAERELLHSLQVERTRSLETLAAEADGQSPGTVSPELAAARAAVVAAQTGVESTLASLDLQTIDPQVYRAHQVAQSRLRALDALRFNLEGGRADAAVVIAAFNRPVEELLDIDQAIVTSLGDSQASGALQAAYAVSHLKDAAFRSTDLLLLTEAGGIEEATTLRLLSEAQSEQQTWLSVALTDLPADEQARLQDAIGDIPDVDELFALIADSERGRGDVAEMTETTAAGADGLRALEGTFIDSVVDTAATERQSALLTAIVFGVLAFVVLALLVLLLVVLSRNVLGPLRDLTRLAASVRELLPDTVERLARGEEASDTGFAGEQGARLLARPDELGELARAINASTEEATRVAVGHAATKAGITRTIEDVARREQSLVERQLSLLDRLEDLEDDPDQLAQLFKLDHLATRMRRNAENLLLLSASRLPGSHDAAAVPLVDVARTAAAEIEHYGRVDVRVGVSDTVLGYAATPISHLLAEVIENATQFSPPTSRVTVTARKTDGDVLVSVIDEGLGMSAEDIEDAQRKLAEPPLLEAAESRRLGLYVVGLIAQKLGIAVQMRTSDGGRGITVEVTIPRGLFVSATSETDRVPAPVTTDAAPGVPSLPAQGQPALMARSNPLGGLQSVPDLHAVAEMQPPPDALSAMGLLLDAEFSEPPALPADVQPSIPMDLPQRGAAARGPVDDLQSGRSISMSTASAGRTVDINPDAISALMGSLSDPLPAFLDPAPPMPSPYTPQEVLDADNPGADHVAPAEDASSAAAQPRQWRPGSRPPAGGVASSWSTPFPPQGA